MTEPISYETHMRSALDLAKEAAAAGDVPVGAVLLDRDGEVVGSDRNRREELRDPIAHAEMLVLSARARGTFSDELSNMGIKLPADLFDPEPFARRSG